MKRVHVLAACGLFLASGMLRGEILGFVEQKFGDLHFEKGKWSRTAELPCFTYTAQSDGATVDVLRIGMGNLVPFRATKGLKVIVCNSTAVFDEGFEAIIPAGGAMSARQPGGAGSSPSSH